MSKIQVTLDAAKVRPLITSRKYTNKEGAEVEVQEVKFELIELKEPKTIVTKDNYRIDKTHFAVKIQTKEEREAKAPAVYVGEGFTTIWSNSGQSQNSTILLTESDDFPF